MVFLLVPVPAPDPDIFKDTSFTMSMDLKALLALGNQMHDALAADDFQKFYDLVEERERLVDKLSPEEAAAKKIGLDKNDAVALEAQYNQILTLLEKKEAHMMEQLQQIDQLKKAGKSYGANYKRRQLINRKLLG